MDIMLRKLFNFTSAVKNKYRTWLFKRVVSDCGSLYVYGHVDIINPRNIHFGNDCTINHGVYLNAFNPIFVGEDVTLSAGAKLISTGIDVDSWKEGGKKHISNNGIIIGNHVWIGANAQILSGVHVKGPYVVVAAGAVVTKDIEEPYCVVAGCPAKVIKSNL